jgi:hypothetical protein
MPFLLQFELGTTPSGCETEEAFFEIRFPLFTPPLQDVEGLRLLLEFDAAMEMRGNPVQLPPTPAVGPDDP